MGWVAMFQLSQYPVVGQFKLTHYPVPNGFLSGIVNISMRTHLILLTLSIAITFGQPTVEQTQTFNLGSSATPSDLQDMTLLLRITGGLEHLTTAPQQITVKGTAAELAIADWLFHELDQPTGSAYQIAKNDSMRVIFVAETGTPRDLQEMGTVVRSTANCRKLMIHGSKRAVAVRGTAEELALVQWLVQQLDQPAPADIAKRSPADYKFATDDAVRIFYTAQVGQPLQELCTRVRSTIRIPQMFVYNHQGALVVRGTVDQLDKAGKLVVGEAR